MCTVSYVYWINMLLPVGFAEHHGSVIDGIERGLDEGRGRVEAGPGLHSQLELPTAIECEALFDRLDVNGNGCLSLAEIDKGIAEGYPHFNHKPALMRAYQAAKNGHGVVRRRQFRLLLKYLVFFNHLWQEFEQVRPCADEIYHVRCCCSRCCGGS